MHSRVVRERVWRAWTSRGELSPSRDNNSVAVQILALRAEQARAHNHRNFSEYQTSDTMAGTPAAVSGLLQRVWAPAKAAAMRERRDLSDYAVSIGDSPEIGASDWRYYAEKVRQLKYDLEESAVKPYFSLDGMTAAVFDVANQL